MPAIPVTIFFSLFLAGTFVVLFAREQRRRGGSAERDSLLPLADETPRPAAHAAVADDHDHAHDSADHACGCRSGLRPPCVGCLKQTSLSRSA